MSLYVQIFGRDAFSDDSEVRKTVSRFRPTDGSEGHGVSSFDARDRDPSYWGAAYYPKRSSYESRVQAKAGSIALK